MVVLAFGFPLVSGEKHRFSDVPAGDPFSRYIETAYAHGVVSGYADGTYRPASNVTRGQLARIVVGAAGLAPLNPSFPSFTDVEAGSAYYSYVETAHANGLLTGYPDGSFRAGELANRGQVCKALAPVVFPPQQ